MKVWLPVVIMAATFLIHTSSDAQVLRRSYGPDRDCPGPGCPGNTDTDKGTFEVEHIRRNAILGSAVGALTRRIADRSNYGLLINFEINSTKLPAQILEEIRQFCKQLDSGQFANVQIFGHTDASGSEQFNLRLSQLRADAVRAVFLDNCNLEVEVTSVGLGEGFLLDGVDPNSNRQRRVEIIVEPNS